jgi:hypothetical protein
MPRAAPVSVVETPEFLTATRRLMGEDERALLVDHLAHNPLAGTLIPGAGGVRKLRWGLDGRGKRGGARVIYFFHSPDVPLFALSAYAKGARADLSQADKNRFRQLARLLVDSFRQSARRTKL